MIYEVVCMSVASDQTIVNKSQGFSTRYSHGVFNTLQREVDECQKFIDLYHTAWQTPAAPIDKTFVYQGFHALALRNHSTAQLYLGYCYQYGFGLAESNPKEAIKWFEMSASEGNIEANFALAQFFSSIKTVASQNVAIFWFNRLVYNSKNLKYYINIGDCYYFLQKYEFAITFYEKAIIHGHALDKKNLIDCYEKIQAWDKFFSSIKSQAEKGNAFLAHRVAECYELGRGVTVNWELALDWYALAADKGIETAKTAHEKLLHRYIEQLKSRTASAPIMSLEYLKCATHALSHLSKTMVFHGTAKIIGTIKKNLLF